MRKIVCALQCSMYEVGSFIMEMGQQVDSVKFIFTGYAQLQGIYKIKDINFDEEDGEEQDL
jgi:hypothetical protein